MTTPVKAVQVVRKAAADVATHGQRLVVVDTGATKNSIGVDLAVEGTEVVAVIGPTTHYAPYLEHGTSRMEPRPFMGPAVDRVLPSFEKAMTYLGGEFL